MKLLLSIGQTTLQHWQGVFQLESEAPIIFLEQELTRFPTQIRCGLWFVAMLFQVYCVLLFLRPFQWLSVQRQLQLLEKFREGTTVFGEMIRLCDSLILMSLLEGRAHE